MPAASCSNLLASLRSLDSQAGAPLAFSQIAREQENGGKRNQDARRIQLEMLIEKRKDFEARLEQVMTTGFSSSALEAGAKKEPLDSWFPGAAQFPLRRCRRQSWCRRRLTIRTSTTAWA